MRNNTKCIYKYAKLLYYEQQSLLLQMATTGCQNTQGYVIYNTKNLISVYALVGFVAHNNFKLCGLQILLNSRY